eukprot:c11212_g1_i1.p1 GENE.c11212_g1_i1~~c11212_g1_i1.p1  ORF type:complete len:223 (-),score=38.96 c11212_g1_i1:21-689(-)
MSTRPPQELIQPVLDLLSQPCAQTLTPNFVLKQHCDQFCLTLDHVFTKEECDALIALSEQHGYKTALLNVGGGREVLMTDFRNSLRCIIDSEQIVAAVCARITPFIPHTVEGRTLVGLNERLRFLRYDVGHVFQTHCDGTYIRGPEAGARQGEQSFITLQIYLNEGCDGGETRFFMDNGAEVDVQPTPGKVLLFQHDIYHQGVQVTRGRKYVIRTDVMYSAK